MLKSFPVPVDLHILNRLSYHLTRLQIQHPSPLPSHLWRGQEFQIFHLGSHVLRLWLPI